MRNRASKLLWLGLCCASSYVDVSETVAKALPCKSCADISETVAMALPCQSSAVSSKQARRLQLRLALS